MLPFILTLLSQIDVDRVSIYNKKCPATEICIEYENKHFFGINFNAEYGNVLDGFIFFGSETNDGEYYAGVGFFNKNEVFKNSFFGKLGITSSNHEFNILFLNAPNAFLEDKYYHGSTQLIGLNLKTKKSINEFDIYINTSFFFENINPDLPYILDSASNGALSLSHFQFSLLRNFNLGMFKPFFYITTDFGTSLLVEAIGGFNFKKDELDLTFYTGMKNINDMLIYLTDIRTLKIYNSTINPVIGVNMDIDVNSLNIGTKIEYDDDFLFAIDVGKKLFHNMELSLYASFHKSPEFGIILSKPIDFDVFNRKKKEKRVHDQYVYIGNSIQATYSADYSVNANRRFEIYGEKLEDAIEKINDLEDLSEFMKYIPYNENLKKYTPEDVYKYGGSCGPQMDVLIPYILKKRFNMDAFGITVNGYGTLHIVTAAKNDNGEWIIIDYSNIYITQEKDLKKAIEKVYPGAYATIGGLTDVGKDIVDLLERNEKRGY